MLVLGIMIVSSRPTPFLATADSVSGITTKGTVTHRGVVAADPSILPLGSVIHVTGAGPYSGIYLVTDTGAKIVGRHIDIYMPSRLEAKQFGRKRVVVRVVSKGDNKKDHREVTPHTAPRLRARERDRTSAAGLQSFR